MQSTPFMHSVHATPARTPYSPLPLAFRWGDISILDAEKALLREALKDPLNERWAAAAGQPVLTLTCAGRYGHWRVLAVGH